MVTRKTSSSSASRKTPDFGEAAAAATAAGAQATANFQEAFVKPLKGIADRMQNLPMAGAAGALLQSGRKDLEALVQANEKSYQGLQAVVQRQTEMLRSSITEWQDAMKGMSPTQPQESLAKLDAMGKAAFKQALDDIRELAELAARSQADALEVVRKRITENVDEVSKLLKPGAK